MSLFIVKDTTNETALYKSTVHISSNKSKSTNNTSLTGTDHCCFKLSKSITLEENLQENQQKSYTSGIV